MEVGQSTGEADRRPVSLLDLPDELIVAIFRKVHAAIAQESRVRRGFLVPTSGVVVNKRIFQLAFPIWASAIRTPERWSDCNAFFGHLGLDLRIRPFVCHLEVFLARGHDKIICAGTAAFTGLTSLSVSLDKDLVEYPQQLIALLRQLNHLKNLKVAERGGFTNLDLNLDRDIPSLRSFDTANPHLLDQLCHNPPSRLRRLTVPRATSLAGVIIPWRAAEHLHLSLPAAFDTPDALLQSLQVVFSTSDENSPLRLRHLTLKWDVLYDRRGNPRTYFAYTHFKALLSILQSSQLEHLELAYVPSLRLAPEGLILPTVRVLTLCGPCNLSEPVNLHGLHTLLTNFPSVTSLHLHEFTLDSPYTSSVYAITSDSALPFPLRFPILNSLLTHLPSTTILDFRFRDNAQHELRWRRNSVKDPFEREHWEVLV
ncbi:hypothetical protein JCM6882_007704 [Rhodosporidiobolus microsporus]